MYDVNVMRNQILEYVTQILIIVLHVLITLVSICRDKSLSSLRCFALVFLYESNIKAIKISFISSKLLEE